MLMAILMVPLSINVDDYGSIMITYSFQAAIASLVHCLELSGRLFCLARRNPHQAINWLRKMPSSHPQISQKILTYQKDVVSNSTFCKIYFVVISRE